MLVDGNIFVVVWNSVDRTVHEIGRRRSVDKLWLMFGAIRCITWC